MLRNCITKTLRERFDWHDEKVTTIKKRSPPSTTFDYLSFSPSSKSFFRPSSLSLSPSLSLFSSPSSHLPLSFCHLSYPLLTTIHSFLLGSSPALGARLARSSMPDCAKRLRKMPRTFPNSTPCRLSNTIA